MLLAQGWHDCSPCYCAQLKLFLERAHIPTLQANDLLLFGPGNKHIPKLAQCFVEVLGRGTQLVEEPLGRRMASLLTTMQPTLPSGAVDAGFSSLNDKQKAAFQAYMAGQPLPQ
jgi:hypothetical protein